MLVWTACSKISGPAALFKKLSPHDSYGQHLKDAGLDHTAIGSSWLQNGDEAVSKAIKITIPYKETGYFPADKVEAAAFKFAARRGENIHIFLSRKPELNFKIFMDLFQVSADKPPQPIASSDTSGSKLDYEINQTSEYLIRLQPELLRGGQYTLVITSGPSLGFPVSPSGKPHIGSYFGDSRDEGGRRHEGIDIFAPKGTPALAAANGTVTGVSENKLGGLVVFVRPDDKDYTLYYAHLEVQLVREGQRVRTGDTVGLIDNTGNAKNTPPHLHFGVYTNSGAVDPLPFVNREIKTPRNVEASLSLLNVVARTTANSKLYSSPNKQSGDIMLPVHSAITISAATDDLYKVFLPNGQAGYVNSSMVSRLSVLRTLKLQTIQPLFDRPDSAAAQKKVIDAGSNVEVLAAFKSYYLVNDNGLTGWINY